MSTLLNNLDYYVDQFYSNYDMESRKQDADKLMKEFHEKYPLEKIKNLSLNEYALGRGGESFCWWIEYHSTVLGSIKGGSAKKHIIYYSRNNEQWVYPSEFESVESAWNKLRGDMVELIENVDIGIDSTNLMDKANTLKAKILYLFYPDKMLPVYSINDMKFFLSELGVDKREWQNIKNDSVAMNKFLRKELYKIEALSLMEPLVLMNFLYRSLNKSGKRHVKIAPGEDGRLWEECKEGEYIAIGWNDVGDLSEYPDYNEFKKSFEKHYFQDNKSTATKKAKEVWLFYSLEAGDKIIANKGTSKIIGIGTVKEEGYAYRPDLNEYRHTIAVEWEEGFNPVTIPSQKQWAFSTVQEVKEKQVESWLKKEIPVILKPEKPMLAQPISEEERLFFHRMEKLLERKGQCILYGPPGTGKTFMARKFVDWKLTESKVDQKSSHAELLTFHPSYTYEDFLEGFKPSKSDSGTISFELEDGVFKRFCKQAERDKDNPYYFIIDELNRGNIPKIFGEIITMLEKDKRSVQVTLPQSKNTFSIPENVYIIATMNTSDRSIKMMDAALKRRFAFVECLPNYGIIDQTVDELVDSPANLLKAINKKLIEKGDRDRQVGHSYFMENGEQILSLDQLKDVFEYEIIPLLQEYCFDDYEELARLLGDEFVNKEEMMIKTDIFTEQDDIFINAVTEIIKGN